MKDKREKSGKCWMCKAKEAEEQRSVGFFDVAVCVECGNDMTRMIESERDALRRFQLTERQVAALEVCATQLPRIAEALERLARCVGPGETLNIVPTTTIKP